MTDYIWMPETEADGQSILRQMVALRAEDDWQNAPPIAPSMDYCLPDQSPRGGVIIRFPEAIG